MDVGSLTLQTFPDDELCCCKGSCVRAKVALVGSFVHHRGRIHLHGFKLLVAGQRCHNVDSLIRDTASHPTTGWLGGQRLR